MTDPIEVTHHGHTTDFRFAWNCAARDFLAALKLMEKGTWTIEDTRKWLNACMTGEGVEEVITDARKCLNNRNFGWLVENGEVGISERRYATARSGEGDVKITWTPNVYEALQFKQQQQAQQIAAAIEGVAVEHSF